MLFDELKGKEIQKQGDMCICIADALCYTAEINILKQLYSHKLFFLKKKSIPWYITTQGTHMYNFHLGQ